MEDEDAALAAGALLRAQQDPADSELNDVDGGAPGEFVEIEHEGQVYKIPAPLKGAFLMNADYTRKTQELAEHRRALEESRRALAERGGLIEASMQDRARLIALSDQLADFEKVDWQAYAAQDPEGAQSLWSAYQTMSQARDRYAYAIQHQEQQAQLIAQRELAEQMQQAGAVLSRQIEGWSPEVANKLVEYASAFGVTIEELREVADPRLWQILHRAYAGDQAQRQQQASKRAEQTQAVRPAVQVSGGASGLGSMRDDLATGEWMRRRNAQMQASR